MMVEDYELSDGDKLDEVIENAAIEVVEYLSDDPHSYRQLIAWTNDVLRMMVSEYMDLRQSLAERD